MPKKCDLYERLALVEGEGEVGERLDLGGEERQRHLNYILQPEVRPLHFDVGYDDKLIGELAGKDLEAVLRGSDLFLFYRYQSAF